MEELGHLSCSHHVGGDELLDLRGQNGTSQLRVTPPLGEKWRPAGLVAVYLRVRLLPSKRGGTKAEGLEHRRSRPQINMSLYEFEW